MAEKEEKRTKRKTSERWTIKELREEALKIPGVQGVHGLNKAELLAALRAEKGIVDTDTKEKGRRCSCRQGQIEGSSEVTE